MKITATSKPVSSAPSFEVGTVFVFVLAAALLMSASCGGSGGAEKARAKLAQMGKDYSPEEFVMCASKGDLTVVKLFLEAGMSVSSRFRLNGEDGGDALSAACRYQQEAVVRLLLKQGADPNAMFRGVTPLETAAAQDNTATMKLLLAKGAKIDAPDAEGLNPLMLAVRTDTCWGRGTRPLPATRSAAPPGTHNRFQLPCRRLLGRAL
jgi:hypothetical protein